MGTLSDPPPLACDSWGTVSHCSKYSMVTGGPESGQRSVTLSGWFHHTENNSCLSVWFLKSFLYRAAQPGNEGEHVPYLGPHAGH